ncbi:ATP synthase F0 subcomplex A subunit [Pseudarcicella hirudinis]|uniref:ATP synthase subunit a n=1 Tax=Pseudarcicella hirudinis TaxID=1079859 RepID=A0A1I5UIU5_9BACT|nr:F0F1 ATP synthase subunit A [Pseudarcicella hirudinis]SFP95213.1 ATP synthase F0 subcomplex A subunit [Pseudarcicella hirudinis]
MIRKFFGKLYFSNILAGLTFLAATTFSYAQEHHTDSSSVVNEIEHEAETVAKNIEVHEEKVDLGHMIMHHIGDDHKWEFAHGVAIYLPCIVKTESGFQFFSAKNLEDEHGQPVEYNGLKLEHGKIHAVDGSHVLDLSITKNVTSLLISAVLLVLIFTSVAKAYTKRGMAAPKGFQSLIEPIIIFIRDEVVKANIGEKHYRRFLPYLLTLFFFIWINNMLGLLPGGANVTGNIAVTMVLAVITFLVTNLNGKSTYWGHIFAMPGVPKWLLVILTPVEIIGIFTKPISLMIRLFANITAGHIIMLSFIGLIFILKMWAVTPVVTGFAVFMNVIELLVAFLQAFIFTMLASSYIGSAVEEHHH